jgi:hypothetical protein
LFARMLRDFFKPRLRLEAEILILRHQLNVLQQRTPRPATAFALGRPRPVQRAMGIRCGRTFRLARTHPVHARSSGSETLSRSRSLADYAIDMHESEFSEATGCSLAAPAPVANSSHVAAKTRRSDAMPVFCRPMAIMRSLGGVALCRSGPILEVECDRGSPWSPVTRSRCKFF